MNYPLRITRFSLLFPLIWLLISPSLAAYVPDQVIVKFKTTPARAVSLKSIEVKNALDLLNVRTIKQVFPDKPAAAKTITSSGQTKQLPDLSQIYLLGLNENSDVLSAVNDLKKLPQVEYAEPNYIVKAFTTPNDPDFGIQWGLNKISAEAAWNEEVGTSDAIVAIVDTGVDLTHEDLSSKVLSGKTFVARTATAKDDNGHGTHLAGIIGAITNNAVGIAGLNWNCRILPVKCLDSSGDGNAADVANGIVYASDYPADVINMSFGDSTDISTIKTAIIYAYGKGSILVAAAGNENTSSEVYPAAYNDYVIAVGATDQNDLRSIWNTSQASNYGTWVDVSAPGTAIYSSWLSGTYKNSNGTSMATPHVSGLASLILSQSPALSQEEVRRRIEDSCDNIDALNSGYAGLLGKGRINAAKALGFPTAQITAPTTSSFSSGILSITGSATSSYFSKYLIFIGSGTSPSLYETIHENSSSVSGGVLYSYDTKNKTDGRYTLKLVCQSKTPTTTETTAAFYIDNTAPLVDISYPSANSTIEGLITIEGTASDANLAGYIMSYAKGDDNFITITQSATASSNSTLGTWNTTGLDGSYKLKLTASDSALNSSSKTINIDITKKDAAPTNIPGLIKSTPNPFNPQVDSNTYFNYTLDANYPTTLYLFSLNGELLYTKSYASGEMGAKAGDNLVPWDGKSFLGSLVGSGVYFFKVAAIQAGSKKIVGSGRVIVIRN